MGTWKRIAKFGIRTKTILDNGIDELTNTSTQAVTITSTYGSRRPPNGGPTIRMEKGFTPPHLLVVFDTNTQIRIYISLSTI
ncbi:hypothetical protein PbJCM13498_09340 [Prolixibacter bellariivorans]|uniref:Uncharacterized protein n=1 Tax=Prolixibacter bellariivorans TaxID=314319 RepID=A0A5M4AWV7_9BACT|nr:hypothetical protein PbJCM13498_09340 [Prolixibacter bellariivorans]